MKLFSHHYYISNFRSCVLENVIIPIDSRWLCDTQSQVCTFLLFSSLFKVCRVDLCHFTENKFNANFLIQPDEITNAETFKRIFSRKKNSKFFVYINLTKIYFSLRIGMRFWRNHSLSSFMCARGARSRINLPSYIIFFKPNLSLIHTSVISNGRSVPLGYLNPSHADSLGIREISSIYFTRTNRRSFWIFFT